MQEMPETWVRSLGWEDSLEEGIATHSNILGWEDSLEEGIATHSNILAWEITWTEEAGGLHSWGRRESDVTEQTHTYQPTMCIVLDLKTI